MLSPPTWIKTMVLNHHPNPKYGISKMLFCIRESENRDGSKPWLTLTGNEKAILWSGNDFLK